MSRSLSTTLFSAGVVTVMTLFSSSISIRAAQRVTMALMSLGASSAYGGVRELLYRLPRTTGCEGSLLTKPTTTSSPTSGRKCAPNPLDA